MDEDRYIVKSILNEIEDRIEKGRITLSESDRKRHCLMIATPGCGKTLQGRYHQRKVEQEGKGCVILNFKGTDANCFDEQVDPIDIEIFLMRKLFDMLDRVNPDYYKKTYEGIDFSKVADLLLNIKNGNVTKGLKETEITGSLVGSLIKAIKIGASLDRLDLVCEGVEYTSNKVQSAISKYIPLFDKAILMVDEDRINLPTYEERRKFEVEHDMAIFRMSYTHEPDLVHEIVKRRVVEVTEFLNEQEQPFNKINPVMDKVMLREASGELRGNLKPLITIARDGLFGSLTRESIMESVDKKKEQIQLREKCFNKGKSLTIFR